MRNELLANILLTGGGALTNNLANRIYVELKSENPVLSIINIKIVI